ncbi:four-carbon acid sugar kinase family protein [Actinomadura rugatobispora]|uniref:Four-carbon acid sugar kinase family protein n=1 Tax=Actinomadura rugatobispora TaxID=1994 RepID=A0ABW1AE29_9ACTN|nr:four-carbon acid sugar kinase family protein [Actinomadura rugatobispora]
MTEVVIVADDLTGAADSAVPFAARASTAVALDEAWPRARVVAVDTDSRYSPEAVAAERVGKAVARGRADGARIVKKIDSTLRGNVGAEIAAAREAAGGRVLAVVAPAFPATGRTVSGGVVRVGGEPLPGRRYGGDVVALLAAAGLRARRIGLDAVRGPGLDARFAQALRDGLDAVVCDGETDADLRAVCDAAGDGTATLLVGSGGLTAALARTLGPAEPVAVTAPAGPALVVIGSYSELARAQRAELVAGGWTPVHVGPGGTGADEAVRAVRAGLAGGDVVLSVDPDAPVDRARAFATARALAAVAVGGADAAGILAATGGETARAVLLGLGATELWPVGEPEPGVVAGRVRGTGALFITKAGAFGDPATLARVVRAVRTEQGE